MLTQTDTLPERFLDVPATQLHTILPGPALIHLPGMRTPALFVSVLLHGNEPTGLLAIQALLRRYYDRPLPRALSIFVGNVAAARHALRRLDHQPDYNRIWLGGDTPEHGMMQQILAVMRTRGTFASIDIHNNTGRNPHYACVNRLEHPFLHLASLFGRTVVFFIKPSGVQTAAFAALCPAVTIECGQPGEPHGVKHACEFIDACLHLHEIPTHPVVAGDIDLFHTVAVVRVPRDVSFSFGAGSTDIQFVTNLDQLNFLELPAGTRVASFTRREAARLEIQDEQGREVNERYFSFDNNEICTRTAIMPSMLSLDAQVIRQDCLCYLMERLPSPESGRAGARSQ